MTPETPQQEEQRPGAGWPESIGKRIIPDRRPDLASLEKPLEPVIDWDAGEVTAQAAEASRAVFLAEFAALAAELDAAAAAGLARNDRQARRPRSWPRPYVVASPNGQYPAPGPDDETEIRLAGASRAAGGAAARESVAAVLAAKDGTERKWAA